MSKDPEDTPTVLARKRRADHTSVPAYKIRAKILLPLASLRRGQVLTKAQENLVALWDDLFSDGPFSWCSDIEIRLRNAFGCFDLDTAYHPRTESPWISFRLLSRAIENGWIPWAHPRSDIAFLEDHSFAMTASWFQSILDTALEDHARADMGATMILASQTAARTLYPAPYDKICDTFRDMVLNGEIRHEGINLDWFHAHPDVHGLSHHDRLFHLGLLPRNRRIDIEAEGLVATLSKLSNKTGHSYRTLAASILIGVVHDVIDVRPDTRKRTKDALTPF